MNKQLVLDVSLEQASAIVQLCQREGRSPVELLLESTKMPRHEPYIFHIENFVELSEHKSWDEIQNKKVEHRTQKGAQNRVYLELLSQLLKWNEPKVSEALQKRRGRTRLYFSKNRKDLSQPKLIPSSDWVAGTKLSSYQKHQILYDLLIGLGFSRDYSWTISWLPNEKYPRVSGLSFKSKE
jgi:hypothetical protein